MDSTLNPFHAIYKKSHLRSLTLLVLISLYLKYWKISALKYSQAIPRASLAIRTNVTEIFCVSVITVDVVHLTLEHTGTLHVTLVILVYELEINLEMNKTCLWF
jgi:hypothetical protein